MVDFSFGVMAFCYISEFSIYKWISIPGAVGEMQERILE